MTVFARRPRLRWIAPALAAVLLGGAGAGVATFSADARGSLVARTAAQLVADVQTAHLDGFSGTVTETADLGLPSLPALGASSSDFSGLISGSHTLRVWYAGPQESRVALLGDLGESDLVRNGSDVWLWSSTADTARHLHVPALADTTLAGGIATSEQAITPQRAAELALRAITPTTTVTTDPTAVVAGRPAYELVLQPHDSGTLVGSVRIAVDGATHVPLRVQVLPRGSHDPSFEVGFTSFDPTTPSDSVFRFTPPPGATVTEGLGGAPRQDQGAAPDAGGAGGTPSDPAVVGSGWTSVVVAPLPTAPVAPAGTSGDPATGLGSVVANLPRVTGAWGSGHLLRGTLFSVLVTDDGRVATGAVPPEALYAALAAS